MKFDVWRRAALGNWIWYVVAVALILGDQLTKFLASEYLTYGRPLYLTSFFDLTLLHNTGAAFSFLSDAGGWQRWAFSLLSLAVSLVLVAWLPVQQRILMKISLSLILAGAVGNLIDRISLGYVVDFISLHYNGWYFPAFNLADSCISVGAALMILEWFVEPKNTENA